MFKVGQLLIKLENIDKMLTFMQNIICVIPNAQRQVDPFLALTRTEITLLSMDDLSQSFDNESRIRYFH